MYTTVRYLLGTALSLLLAGPALACYTVYNRANQVVYHAVQAPVNMSYQLHQTLPAFYPDAHMVFSIVDNNCPQVNVTRIAGVAYAAGPGQAMQEPRAPRASRN